MAYLVVAHSIYGINFFDYWRTYLVPFTRAVIKNARRYLETLTIERFARTVKIDGQSVMEFTGVFLTGNLLLVNIKQLPSGFQPVSLAVVFDLLFASLAQIRTINTLSQWGFNKRVHSSRPYLNLGNLEQLVQEAEQLQQHRQAL